MEKKTTLLLMAFVSIGITVLSQSDQVTDPGQNEQVSINTNEIDFTVDFHEYDDFISLPFDGNIFNYLILPPHDYEPLVIIDPVSNLNNSESRAKLRKMIFSSVLMFSSGFSDGTSEVLKIKYESFERVFPKANDQFWDYNISWTNKYKNGSPPDAKFIGSKSAFVWTTDGYHLMRMIRNCTMILAVTIPISTEFYKNWRNYVKDGVIYYLAYTAGFNFAYEVVFP